MCHQHSRSRHVHNRNPLLGGNRFKAVAAPWSPRRDLGSFASRIPRIQNVHWNIFLDSRQHRRGVQNLGAKISKFRRLVEADHLNPPRLGAKVRIGSHHPVHIGPDLDALRSQPCPYKGG